MGRIPPEDLELIRAQVPIAELIGEHVALKPAGASLKGLCPFHQEKTPSFIVNTTTKTWHCFGCGEGDDVIGFISRIEGEGFRWAVQYLAERYGLPIHFDAPGEAAKSNRSRLIEAHEVAARAYGHTLVNDPDAEAARSMLTARGFDIATAVATFGCGYAPRTRSMSALLESQGFTRDEIVEAGLARERHGKLHDVFHGRALWTIRDSFGKSVGFGARKLHDDDPIDSKFINTAETPIYKKTHVLYGLDLARKEITRTRQAVVVEGYTDVMAMHLAGVTNAVAACGTAFTSEHLHTLRRLVGESGEVVFAFDDDAAGRKAARSVYRDSNRLLRRLSALPAADGLDPDEVRRHRGDRALAELVENRIPLARAVIRMVVDSMPQESAEDRVATLDAVLPYLNEIADPLVRSEYAAEVAGMLRFSADQVSARISATDGSGRQVNTGAPQTDQEGLSTGWVEKELLKVFAQDRAIADRHLSAWDVDTKFTQAPSLEAIDLLRNALADPNPDGRPWPLHVAAQASTDRQKSMVTALTAEALPIAPQDAQAYADDLLARLDAQGYDQAIAELRQKIAGASDGDERTSALKQLMALQRQSTSRSVRS